MCRLLLNFAQPLGRPGDAGLANEQRLVAHPDRLTRPGPDRAATKRHHRRQLEVPAELRRIVCRTPQLPGEQADLGEDPNWRGGAFATDTTTGQVKHLDVRHRSHAHVDDRIKELRACGAPTALEF